MAARKMSSRGEEGIKQEERGELCVVRERERDR